MYDADARWKEIKETLPHNFDSVTADEMFVRAASWELPATCKLMVRVFDRKKGRLVERAFSNMTKANEFLNKADKLGLEVTEYDNDQMATSYELQAVFNGDADET